MAAVFVYSFGSAPNLNWVTVLKLGAAFAIPGALYGTILAFDRTADASGLRPKFIRRLELPLVRTLICSALSGGFVYFFHALPHEPLPFSWVWIGAIVGAGLGWLGWRWAKYVEF